ncbi:MAG TPA: hypothetical protein VFP80_12475 [Thermoanaerobaculia bacterium]|nr:hypothetical protein [Thermoanaerobaculia bacterium]
MNRRLFAVAALAALTTASMHAADGSRKQDAALPQAGRPLALHALFAHAPGVIAEGPHGMIVTGPTHADVILARIDTDGKLVKVCVDNEAAARRFLDAPIAAVEGRKAKDQ